MTATVTPPEFSTEPKVGMIVNYYPAGFPFCYPSIITEVKNGAATVEIFGHRIYEDQRFIFHDKIGQPDPGATHERLEWTPDQVAAAKAQAAQDRQDAACEAKFERLREQYRYKVQDGQAGTAVAPPVALTVTPSMAPCHCEEAAPTVTLTLPHGHTPTEGYVQIAATIPVVDHVAFTAAVEALVKQFRRPDKSPFSYRSQLRLTTTRDWPHQVGKTFLPG